jgi:hypothetical protein
VKQAAKKALSDPVPPRGDLRIEECSGSRMRRLAANVPGAFALLALAVAGPVVPPAVCDEMSRSEPREDGHPAELEALLAGFAAMPGLSARFREERHLSLLQEPLLSNGALFFAPPDRLLRRVDDPVESTLLVEGNRLTFSGAEGPRTIDLDSHPAVRAFVDSFRLLLAGNLDALGGVYRIEFEEAERSAAREWRIRLRPRRPPLEEIIASIEIVGRGQTLDELRLLEVRGDETITRFWGVDTNRRFGEGELAELFRLPEP